MEQDKKSTSEISVKNQDLVSFFEKDPGFVFAYKKTEKLAAAVYMVTNLFADSEPLKWTLRKKVSDFLSFTLTYKDITNSGMSDFVNSAKTKVLEITSLLEVTTLGGLVSSMNFSILKTEFLNLIDIFSSSNIPKESSGTAISSTFFEIPDTRAMYPAPGTYHAKVPNPSFKMSFSPIKDESSQRDQFKRSNRQNIILALIKKRKEVTIKDISVVIKDCSEKTIQRELISFIEAGVLKRVGERRWSKYSLV